MQVFRAGRSADTECRHWATNDESMGPLAWRRWAEYSWRIEVAYCDGKQILGFHDPMVWTAQSVQRAHPMAWFVGSLVVLWYAQTGQHEPPAQRHRPWYKDKVSPTFADLLACCRLHLWRNWLQSEPGHTEENLDWLLEYLATAA